MSAGDVVLLASVVVGCALCAVSGPITQHLLERRARRREVAS